MYTIYISFYQKKWIFTPNVTIQSLTVGPTRRCLYMKFLPVWFLADSAFVVLTSDGLQVCQIQITYQPLQSRRNITFQIHLPRERSTWAKKTLGLHQTFSLLFGRLVDLKDIVVLSSFMVWMFNNVCNVGITLILKYIWEVFVPYSKQALQCNLLGNDSTSIKYIE